ncbi:MAG: EF2563 family selenium-dependent molybdenum hydroxylase system protein [Clostridiales bacterium]|nr:EF2563 family selenium-dependent molybdenum hydroxylase system protein [Clostridiales bacterium]
MLVIIKGAGDLASGVAVRLHRAGIGLVMTEIAHPTAIRRPVSFCRAVWENVAEVEGIRARLAFGVEEAYSVVRSGEIAVLVDPEADCAQALQPDALVDATLAKRNLNTRIGDAPAVLALGPGFTAGVDCHAVIETMRGHDLGRVLTNGSAQPNTGVPGLIAGYGSERILRAPRGGFWQTDKEIGAHVEKGETVATVDGEPVYASLTGVLRGLLPDGTPVTRGMKSGDVDPRDRPEYCFTVSDKARAIGGGVLEALLMLSGGVWQGKPVR